MKNEKNVYVKYFAPCGSNIQKAISSSKVKAKVTRLMNLMSHESFFNGVYMPNISYGSKVKANVKVDQKKTDRQTNRKINHAN